MPKSTKSPASKRSSKCLFLLSFYFNKILVTFGQAPENWKCAASSHSSYISLRFFWDSIVEMRKQHQAPVDTLGSQTIASNNVSKKEHDFQSLVGIMLSSLTKDETTSAAANNLKQHGLNVETILHTSEEDIDKMISKVGFHKTKAQFPYLIILRSLFTSPMSV